MSRTIPGALVVALALAWAAHLPMPAAAQPSPSADRVSAASSQTRSVGERGDVARAAGGSDAGPVPEGEYFGQSPSAVLTGELRGDYLLLNGPVTVFGAGVEAQLTCGHGFNALANRIRVDERRRFEGSCHLNSRGPVTLTGTRVAEGVFPTLVFSGRGSLGEFEVTLIPAQRKAAFLADVAAGKVRSTKEWLALAAPGADRTSQSTATPQALDEARRAEERRAADAVRVAEERRAADDRWLADQQQAQSRLEEQRVAAQREEALAARVRDVEDQLRKREQDAKKREADLQRQLVDAQAAAAAAPVARKGRHALVIGIEQYQSVPKLRTAVADAQAMGTALRRFGYAVREHTDIDERSFKRAVREFIAEISPGDEVVFFYAGHGVQMGGLNYLLPVETRGGNEREVRDESIQLQKILDDLADARPSFALVIADACRDNPFKGQGRNVGGRGLTPTTPATGQMIIFSAGANQQALDVLGPNDPSPNSVFTRVLVAEMAKPDMPVDRIARSVRSAVVRLARSVGHEQVPALYDQSIGEFYFSRR